MKILVISDTHGETSAAQRLIKKEKPNYVIHLGDCVRDAEELSNLFPILPICKVAGNNDWFSREATEKILTLNDTRIFLCHGHTTGVKNGLEIQAEKARRQGCSVSLFGHTHSPLLENRNGILLLNPGSITYSRTYAALTVETGKFPAAELRHDA